MAFVIADRVRESSTTTGTGSIALGGAVTGYQTFGSVLTTADTTYYTIADQGGANWEVGIGTFTSPSTLARTTILSSSNGGSIVTFTAGTKDVFISLPASKTNTNDQPNVIAVNSTSDALRITQTGTGNALVVEDSANPDATPFVVDASGNVGVGTSSPSAKLDIASGNLAFSNTGQRITGDMSNVTHANRLSFQSSTTNGSTSPFIIPNGTGTTASIVVANASDPTNSSFGQLAVIGSTDVRILSGIIGTGTYLPMTFYTSANERMRIDASGNVGIGTTTIGSKLTVNGDVAGTFFVNPTTVSANYTVPTNYNAMTAGPITVNSGVTVTVPSGSTWVIA